MMNQANSRRLPQQDSTAGFSMGELLVSVTIITLLMSAVFAFIFQTQKRFQSNIVISESNQGARAAMEILTQEIGQAGRNPNFLANKTSPNATAASGQSQCVTLNDISRINPGDWLSVDTGIDQELAQVSATSNTPVPVPPPPGLNCTTVPVSRSCPCPDPPNPPTINQVRVILQLPHGQTLVNPTGTPLPFPVMSYKFSYPTGILTANGSLTPPTTINGMTNPNPIGTVCTPTPPAGIACPTTSDDHTLEFYGDINDDPNGRIFYVVYSLNPTTDPPTNVCIPAAAPGTPCPAASTYTLYNLYRSIKRVQFPAAVVQTVNNQASALVQNVLYSQWDAANLRPTAPAQGPTTAPIFAYPQTFKVGITPNVITVIGTIQVTISVAVNPRSLESGIIEWYTMATQIRPLNLAAAVAVNLAGGQSYMARAPLDLPMQNPVNYYQ